MSGGYVAPLEKWHHQVVTLIFKGPIEKADLDKYNAAFEELKIKLGPKMIAITVQGDPTPRGREGRPMVGD